MRKKSIYALPTPEEQLKRDNFKKEIAVRQAAIIKTAAECLADPKFIKYREEFELFRQDVFAKLADPIDSDPVKDAHYLRACINTVIVLDKLLKAPGKDIK